MPKHPRRSRSALPLHDVNVLGYWNQVAILGCTMGDMTEFREVVALLTSGAITPVIDRVVDAAEAPEAFRRLEAGEQFSKIVLRW